ncbi:MULTISPECIES: inorganic diphosphatase [Thermus]|uniref:inorganic diphosphatase n=1 Tax=Thermus antranikianii TaxID=88190 RepID=A0ABY7RQQ8_9DEIN|nr:MULTISPECIES: inorganic diphosphatase [Thermus]WCM39570.1 ADP-ribosylglycohydrolase [Thermus antranikianii]
MNRLRMVVEWSKGSSFRYAWKDGNLALVAVDQPAPVNYGLIPGLINPADGEEVDAVFLGPPLPPGTQVEGEVVGIMWLADGDHKILLEAQGQGPSPREAQELLAWFHPSRKPLLLGPQEARDWLKALLRG